MLCNGMAESDRNEVMLHYQAPVIKALLAYLYTGSLACEDEDHSDVDGVCFMQFHAIFCDLLC